MNLLLIITLLFSINSLLNNYNWIGIVTFSLSILPLYLSLISLVKIPKYFLIFKYILQQTLFALNRKWAESFILKGILYEGYPSYKINSLLKCCSKNGILESKYFTENDLKDVLPNKNLNLRLEENADVVCTNIIDNNFDTIILPFNELKKFEIKKSVDNFVCILKDNILFKTKICNIENFLEFCYKDEAFIMTHRPKQIFDGNLHRLNPFEKFFYAIQYMDYHGNFNKKIEITDLSKADNSLLFLYILLYFPIIVIKTLLFILLFSIFSILIYTKCSEYCIVMKLYLLYELSIEKLKFFPTFESNFEGTYWIS